MFKTAIGANTASLTPRKTVDSSSPPAGLASPREHTYSISGCPTRRSREKLEDIGRDKKRRRKKLRKRKEMKRK